MRLLGIGALIGVTLAIGCSSTGSTNAAPKGMGATPEKGLAISVDRLAVPYCPECEMSFRQFAIRDTLTYDGKLYGFCSEGCKASFAQRMGIN